MQPAAAEGGPARPTDRQFDLVHDAAMGTIPTRAEEPRELSCPNTPIDPREDHAADEENQERSGQEVFHGRRNSRVAVI